MKAVRSAARLPRSLGQHVSAKASVAIDGLQPSRDLAEPAFLVNSAADAESLISWCIDQLAAVNRLLAVVATPPASGDAAALAVAVGRLTLQAEGAARAALRVHLDSFLD